MRLTTSPQVFLRRMEDWVCHDLVRLETGGRQDGASPLELVDALRPYLDEAKDVFGPRMARVRPGVLRRLRAAFDAALDASERTFASAGEPPHSGLGYLAGMEDLLVAINILLNLEVNTQSGNGRRADRAA